jgi:hypothetical protein
MTSEKKLNAHNRDAVSRKSGPAAEEQRAARAALEACAGRTVSDMEWNRARARLMEFVSILCVWHLGALSGESELRKAA